MKKIILLAFFSVVCLSCSKVEDDTGNVCRENCTTIKGTFVTQNNIPLKNVQLRLDFHELDTPPFGGGDTRRIEKARTDENGFYKMEFFLEEGEIGENSRGRFELMIDATALNSEIYYRSNISYPGAVIYSLPSRDTIIEKSFYIPTKEHIIVNLTGFSPVLEGDFFEVRTLFPYGIKLGEDEFFNPVYQKTSTAYGKYAATNQNQTFNNVIVALNETNIVKIGRRKNGVTTYEDKEVYVTENNNIILTFQY